MIKIGTKFAKVKIHIEGYTIMCISVDNTPVEILASELLVAMEIMMKHCWGQFLGPPSMLA